MMDLVVDSETCETFKLVSPPVSQPIRYDANSACLKVINMRSVAELTRKWLFIIYILSQAGFLYQICVYAARMI